MFSNNLNQKNPIDVTPCLPITKYIYFNLDGTQEIFKQKKLTAEDWELILKTINLGINLSPPLSKKVFPHKHAFSLFQEQLDFCMSAHFDSALSYLTAKENGMLIKIETETHAKVTLENIDWMYILTKRSEDISTENFSYIPNFSYVPKYHHTWKDFQGIWDSPNKKFFVEENLMKCATEITSVCNKFLTAYNSQDTPHKDHATVNALSKTPRLISKNKNNSEIPVENFFIFYVDCLSLLAKIQSSSLRKDFADLDRRIKTLWENVLKCENARPKITI